MNNQPIGIIDSGVGGLSIWKEVITLLPSESTIYIADSKYCPYGKKTPEQIYTYAKRLVKYLMEKKVKLIIVACNTMSVHILHLLRRDFPNISIIGTVPAIKTAALLTKKGKIGILATSVTAESRYLSKLIISYANHHRIITVGTDKLVPFVEIGELDGERLRKILSQELAVFKQERIDTLVLACSHFPFLKAVIQELYNFDTIIDSGIPVARQARRVLTDNKLHTTKTNPTHSVYTTGNSEVLQQTITVLLDSPFSQKISKLDTIHI